MTAIMAAALASCNPPERPPEAAQAEKLHGDLRRASVTAYAPEQFRLFEKSLLTARTELQKTEDRFFLFRDYGPTALLYREALEQGNRTSALAENRLAAETAALTARTGTLTDSACNLRAIARNLNEGRLILSYITQADVALEEACRLLADKRIDDAKERAARAESLVTKARAILTPIVSRYADRGQIAEWTKLVRETVQISSMTGDYAIVVSKADRSLYLYRAGKLQKTYAVGLGFNGTADKLHAGDRATPEGKYSIQKKIPRSKYHKALLLDYPNSEDRRRFALYKKKGIVPRGASIGGLIEIHGGGAHGMTYGCIALEDHEMDSLFSLLQTGTPVTIVGALGHDNPIAGLMEKL